MKSYLSVFLKMSLLVAFSVTAFAKGKGGVFGVTKSSDGVVMVDLTPKRFENGELVVEIGVNTHSVNDLRKYDLKKIVVLRSGGKEIYPTKAPKLGGHHSNGKLVFKISKLPEKFRIVIKDLNRPGEREFVWP